MFEAYRKKINKRIVYLFTTALIYSLSWIFLPLLWLYL